MSSIVGDGQSHSEIGSAEGAQEWFASGLRFECTMCGNCCSGPPGAVWFTQEEARSMARELNVPEQEFLKAYARRVGVSWSLKEKQTDHGLDCIFLDRETRPGKALCKVYKSRPTQCRTWPFWPEMLESAEAWRDFKKRTPCPGMDTGKSYTYAQIRVIREEAEAR
ncbi:MAG TPA: YkgJ family cysteine cluster protein [Phycisphaerales bacterium]|nr:YkgJ family cysteine cluster protein [Phycisphaerales bacterium]